MYGMMSRAQLSLIPKTYDVGFNPSTQVSIVG
jgi:hypothetical protein